MKAHTKYKLILLAVVALAIAWLANGYRLEMNKSASEDPVIWEDDIRSLEQKTSGPPGSIIFIGSSSIRLWGTLANDMSPMTVVKRGFGGAKLADVVYYATRLVAIDSPGAIVIFAGTNDIVPGSAKQPKALLKSYQELVAKIRSVHQATPIYYIAVTPSPSRWQVWPVAQKTNALIEAYCASDDSLHYIDTGAALMSNDEPDDRFYRVDGLHLSEAGYQVWTQIIRSRLNGTKVMNHPHPRR